MSSATCACWSIALISGTNVKLEVDYGRDLWPVQAPTSAQFEQVLLNLAVNARDAMPQRRHHHASNAQSSGTEDAAALQPARHCQTKIS